jgi:two-component system response regulator HydG
MSNSGLISKNVLPWEIISGPEEESFKKNINAEKANPPIAALKDAASQAEYETIMNVLKQVKFNKTKAADILQIDRKTLYNKIRNFEENNK